jgi:hypothetical protein
MSIKNNIKNQIRTTRLSTTIKTVRVITVNTTTIIATTTNITKLQEIRE